MRFKIGCCHLGRQPPRRGHDCPRGVVEAAECGRRFHGHMASGRGGEQLVTLCDTQHSTPPRTISHPFSISFSRHQGECKRRSILINAPVDRPPTCPTIELSSINNTAAVRPKCFLTDGAPLSNSVGMPSLFDSINIFMRWPWVCGIGLHFQVSYLKSTFFGWGVKQASRVGTSETTECALMVARCGNPSTTSYNNPPPSFGCVCGLYWSELTALTAVQPASCSALLNACTAVESTFCAPPLVLSIRKSVPTWLAQIIPHLQPFLASLVNRRPVLCSATEQGIQLPLTGRQVHKRGISARLPAVCLVEVGPGILQSHTDTTRHNLSPHTD